MKVNFSSSNANATVGGLAFHAAVEAGINRYHFRLWNELYQRDGVWPTDAEDEALVDPAAPENIALAAGMAYAVEANQRSVDPSSTLMDDIVAVARRQTHTTRTRTRGRAPFVARRGGSRTRSRGAGRPAGRPSCRRVSRSADSGGDSPGPSAGAADPPPVDSPPHPLAASSRPGVVA